MVEILDSKGLRICHLEGQLRVYVHRPGFDLGLDIPYGSVDFLDLADQFQDAAVLLRSIVAESDPGRIFEENQALQFGAQKLEGDL